MNLFISKNEKFVSEQEEKNFYKKKCQASGRENFEVFRGFRCLAFSAKITKLRYFPVTLL